MRAVRWHLHISIGMVTIHQPSMRGVLLKYLLAVIGTLHRKREICLQQFAQQYVSMLARKFMPVLPGYIARNPAHITPTTLNMGMVELNTYIAGRVDNRDSGYFRC